MFLFSRYKMPKAESFKSTGNGCYQGMLPVTRTAMMLALSHSDPFMSGRRDRYNATCLRCAADADVQSTSSSDSISSGQLSPKKAAKPLVLPRSIPVAPDFQALDLKAFENGALLIDKPLEWTSMDVCAKLRTSLRFLDAKLKVGHAGTLDPMATGLLIVGTGRGTKSCDTFMAMAKSYSGTLRLGEGTVTYDAEVEVSERLPWEDITDEDLQRTAASFTGEQMQVPPMYSAIKIQGQKLYDLARDGQVVERAPRHITISSLELRRDPHGTPQDVHFMVHCSKGTYVRSLAYDIGRSLGTVAHLRSLRRESIGEYSIKDAWSFKDLLEQLRLHCAQSSFCSGKQWKKRACTDCPNNSSSPVVSIS